MGCGGKRGIKWGVGERGGLNGVWGQDVQEHEDEYNTSQHGSRTLTCMRRHFENFPSSPLFAHFQWRLINNSKQLSLKPLKTKAALNSNKQ